MKFNWLDYLSLAENLVNEVSSSLKQSNDSSDSTSNSSLDEAKLRCAISRAYYSVFCLARNYLRDVEEDYEIRKWKEYGIRPHQYVIGKFQESNRRNYKTIAIHLERLLLSRHQVDYEDVVSHTLPAKAKSSISAAKQIIEQLKELQ